MMKRVRVQDYATLKKDSNLLVPVASVGQQVQKLHWRAAEGFASLAAAVRSALEIELKAASGWRPHRWDSRKEYEEVLVRRYGSIAEGRRWLAFDSPHETGLAVDIGVGGLWPDRRTVSQQRRSPLHRWLVEHAAGLGWFPYSVEPWHWEYPVSPTDYQAPGRGAEAILEAGECAEEEVGVCEVDESCASEDSMASLSGV